MTNAPNFSIGNPSQLSQPQQQKADSRKEINQTMEQISRQIYMPHHIRKQIRHPHSKEIEGSMSNIRQ